MALLTVLLAAVLAIGVLVGIIVGVRTKDVGDAVLAGFIGKWISVVVVAFAIAVSLVIWPMS